MCSGFLLGLPWCKGSLKYVEINGESSGFFDLYIGFFFLSTPSVFYFLVIWVITVAAKGQFSFFSSCKVAECIWLQNCVFTRANVLADTLVDIAGIIGT